MSRDVFDDMYGVAKLVKCDILLKLAFSFLRGIFIGLQLASMKTAVIILFRLLNIENDVEKRTEKIIW